MYRTATPIPPRTVVRIPSKLWTRKSKQTVSHEKSSTLTTTLLLVAGFLFFLLFLGLLGYGIAEAVKNSERHAHASSYDRIRDRGFRTYDPSVQIPISLSDYQQFQILKNSPSTCTPQFCKSTYDLITQGECGECPESDDDCTPCTPCTPCTSDYCQSTFSLIPKNSVSIYDPTKQTPIPLDTYNAMKIDLEAQKKATTDAEEKTKQLQTKLDQNVNCLLPVCTTKYPIQNIVYQENDQVDPTRFCPNNLGKPCVLQALVVKQYDGTNVDVTQAVQSFLDSNLGIKPTYFSFSSNKSPSIFPPLSRDPFPGYKKFLYVSYVCVPTDQKCS